MKDKKKAVLFPVLGIILLYVLQFLTHRSVPFMMDDEWYSTNLATGAPLQGLSDILEGQVWHYLNWGGRSITHAVLQLTLMTGEVWADILNTLVTLFLAYMICVVSGQKNIKSLLLSSFLLICFNANVKMSMFWQSGLVNYVYSSAWILVFLWAYIKRVDMPCCNKRSLADAGEMVVGTVDADKQLKGKKYTDLLLALGMLPLGLMTGWSNENMGPTCFVLAVMAIVYCKWVLKQRIPLWMFAGALTSLIGSACVILAPGNFVRSAAIEPKGVLQTVWERFFSMYEAGIQFLFPTVIFLVVLLLIFLIVLRGKLQTGQVFLMMGMVLSYGAMVLSPHYPDRATFGTMVLGIVVINGLLAQIIELYKQFAKYVNILLVSVWGYSMIVLLEIMLQGG